MPSRRHLEPRGSTIVLVMILLLVLTTIGISAVQLSSQGRVNAAAKGTRDYLVACANAARLQLWAELTRMGPEYLQNTNPAVEVRLPDGSVLTAPGYFASEGKDGLPVVELISTVPMFTNAATLHGDLTNTIASSRKSSLGSGNAILARCRDAKGRELAVEVITRFAL